MEKESEVVFFKTVTFLKVELHICFPLFSLLEPLTHRSLDANFLGNCDVTSGFESPGS